MIAAWYGQEALIKCHNSSGRREQIVKEGKELEAERLARLAELRKSDHERGETQPLEFRYGPESFGCHEALHTTSLLLGLIDRELSAHGSIIQNAEWYAHVRRAQDELAALYQKIGAAHLAGTDQRH